MSEEEGDPYCDECGRWMDGEEAEINDGICYECTDNIKAARVRRKIPSTYEVRQVTGSHRKPCSDCGFKSWLHGEYYVFNSSNPWGTGKFCLDCAENRDWGDELEDDEDEMIRTNFIRQQREERERAAFQPDPMFNISCHTGFPADHPTAGRHHIGGLSSVMINPGMPKMTRECVRDNGFGRKCRGEIVSFTEEGFTLATCSICCLPSASPKDGIGEKEEDDDDGEKKDASESKRGSTAEESESKKRQRI
eukprot:scaffold2854_cov140-Skeletonema_menzelii.AAC.15